MRKNLLSLIIASIILLTVNTPQTFAAEQTSDQVVRIANQYLNVPYKWGGSTPSGFDCSGFILYVFNKVGIKLPQGSDSQYAYGTNVSKAELKPGDLVFFKDTYKAGISHTGIYIGSYSFISATNSGVKIDSINDPYYWGEKYAGAKRIIDDTVKAETITTMPAGQYYDVPHDFWAYSQINSLSKAGIINGYDSSMFMPNKKVTRAEVAKMLSDTFHLSPSTNHQFSDVSSSHWAATYINAVAKEGYFTGYGNQTFQPDKPITRGEIATLFTKAFTLPAGNSSQTFNDLDKSHWAYQAIQTLTASSIAFGYSDQTFQPNRETTRSEFAVFLFRALQK
ncbi:S-layer homology domain-containing protein [Peribacillus loiseleuriae]|uniref:C40 family peptidase n=1 Tax=Peribacillus loiseleuriae TaxID=1679170 RepID=UPI003828183B